MDLACCGQPRDMPWRDSTQWLPENLPYSIELESPFLLYTLYSCFWTSPIIVLQKSSVTCMKDLNCTLREKWEVLALCLRLIRPIPFLRNFHNIKISHPTIRPRAILKTLCQHRPWYRRVIMESGAFSYWNAQPMADAESQFQELLEA